MAERETLRSTTTERAAQDVELLAVVLLFRFISKEPTTERTEQTL
ncbi:hypothetical protein JOF29_002907 [Kribbella aluminosa]|uniref:Uncharacterized protein n=1 Tax=Kribbella aluminosa TaxID=416017 RepID=A0ABS4UJN6_9ACTN|nr:hypothetical protein [Kribbella aluminosa]MBP2351824.1 hypothetical protein [Kribbella aluminosa]